MSPKIDDTIEEPRSTMKQITRGVKQTLKEPIMKLLLRQSSLTETQLETLLIDLVVEDQFGNHISYCEKATFRSKSKSRRKGVSRGAFNRTLKQARQNVTKTIYTMLLLAYLGLFDFTIFRPFEEIATKIGDYRRIREILAGKSDLTNEEIESYRTAEVTIYSAIQELTAPLILKSDIARQKSGSKD